MYTDPSLSLIDFHVYLANRAKVSSLVPGLVPGLLPFFQCVHAGKTGEPGIQFHVTYTCTQAHNDLFKTRLLPLLESPASPTLDIVNVQQ